MRIALLLFLFICNNAFAQNAFKGVLLSASDSTLIPFASIKVKETGQAQFSDEKGAFTIPLAPNNQKITLVISSIGINDEVSIIYPKSALEKIYVNVHPAQLAEYQFVQLSAKDVVIKAIRAIPYNYSDSSYVAYSSFRQYQKINNVVGNTLEIEPVIMFRLTRKKNELISTEGFAIQKYWKNVSLYSPETMFDYDGLSILLLENPVYHLPKSSLTIGKLSNYSFWFDTTIHIPGCYVVKYYSRSTHDKHGVDYPPHREVFLDEGTEIGVLTIDRNSFAIKRFEQTAKRNPAFSYYGKPNLVIPERKYFAELVDGNLIAEYEQSGGKWFVRHLLHEYTNDFYEAGSGTKAYRVTDVFEWTSGSISRYVDGSLMNKFYNKLVLPAENADSSFFVAKATQFHFTNIDSVYHTLTK